MLATAEELVDAGRVLRSFAIGTYALGFVSYVARLAVRRVRLDRLATDIRSTNGKVLNRAEIIRALIDGLIDSGMDITAAASESDLRARVARRLGSLYR